MLTRISPKFSLLATLPKLPKLTKSPKLPKLMSVGLLGSLTVLGLCSLALPGRSGVQSLNILVSLQGDVQLQRQAWLGPFARFQPARIGDILTASDRLRVPSNASARVICDNLQPWDVPANRDSTVVEGCPNQGNQKLYREDRSTVSPRGPVKPDVLYLISPASTTILNDRPTFRWHPRPQSSSSSSYKVEITSAEGFRWTTIVTEPLVTYTGQEPLVNSDYYLIKVSSPEQPCEDFSSNRCSVRFQLLSPDQATIVQAEINQLQTQLSGIALPMTIAYRYQTLGLKQAALETLEQAVAANPDSPQLHQQLGIFYHNAGLLPLAQIAYQKALELTPATFLEDRGNLQEGLGQIAQVQGKITIALEWFEQAKNSYEQLGDRDKQDILESNIEILER